MEQHSCPVNSLPHDMRDRFLQQAFQQLDLRHRLQVAPCVCRLWQQLAPGSCPALEVRLAMDAVVELSCWLLKHKPPLDSISIDVCFIAPPTLAGWSGRLMASICTITQLSSLSLRALMEETRKGSLLEYGGRPDVYTRLSSLTNLTSLSLNGFLLPEPALDSILLLSQLRCLEMQGTATDAYTNFLRELSTSLVQLTSLGLEHGFEGPPASVAALSALPSLQQLRLLPGTGVEVRQLRSLESLPVCSIGVSLEPHDAEAFSNWLRVGGRGLESLHIFPLAGFRRIPLLAAHLCLVPKLRNLIACCVEGWGQATELAALTELTQLGLPLCGLDDVAVMRLSSLHRLQVLTLCDNPQITGAGGSFECLAANLAQLTRLKLGGYSPGAGQAAADAAQQAFDSRVLRRADSSICSHFEFTLWSMPTLARDLPVGGL